MAITCSAASPGPAPYHARVHDPDDTVRSSLVSHDDDLLISIHIPKTGGRTFRQILGEMAPGHIQADYGDRPIVRQSRLTELRNRFRKPRVRPGTRIIHGHFAAAKYWRYYPDASYLAWFRDPVERLASHYYYWQRHPDMKNEVCRRMIEQDLSLEAFAAQPEMRDVQTRFMKGVPVGALAFAGITEQYGRSIRLFLVAFAPDLDVEVAERNVNPEKAGSRYDIEPSVRQDIEALNGADRALYGQARSRFEELCREHGMD
jgi:hypothetical protein